MGLLNRTIVALLRATPTGVLWRFARRYVAGATLAEAIQLVRHLNAQGTPATLDILGEHVGSPAEARADGAAYREALRAIQREEISCNISVSICLLRAEPPRIGPSGMHCSLSGLTA